MYQRILFSVVASSVLVLVLGILGLNFLARNRFTEATKLSGGDETNPEDKWPGRRRARLLAREKLPAKYQRLKPIHTLMGMPGPSDWLACHEESGQSLRVYKRQSPVRPGKRLTTIYIQPLGKFTEEQAKIVRLSAEYMGIYFNVPVKIKSAFPLKMVPRKARRQRFGHEQILSIWVLDKLLRPCRPKDALAYIAFTGSDLWPGRGWNFVYGQASLRARVGVWSIHRNGDPAESEQMFRLCLLRTIKTATHETGHILTMQHCIAYDCNMNGCNHRLESDTRPLALCPICLAKLCWNINCDPAPRFEKLIAFCEKNKLKKEAGFFKKSLQLIQKTQPVEKADR